MKLSYENEDKIDKPHDKRFKALLSNEKRFLNFLKDCVKQPWVEQLNVSAV